MELWIGGSLLTILSRFEASAFSLVFKENLFTSILTGMQHTRSCTLKKTTKQTNKQKINNQNQPKPNKSGLEKDFASCGTFKMRFSRTSIHT